MFSPRSWAVIFCALLCAAACPAARAADVPTNLDLMSNMATQVVEELLANLPSHVTGDQVMLSPYGQGERYQFLTNQFSIVLSGRGYKVSASNVADSVSSAATQSYSGGQTNARGYKLIYQALDFRLMYPKAYRAYLIGGKRVKREADIRVLAKVVDETDGSIVWMGEASRSHSDNFSVGDIDEVEAGLYRFTKPERPETNWGKIVEPVVVTGIIVGLIYLFFSNQNDS